MGLKQAIAALAEEFSEGILAAIRGASLEELHESTGGGAPRARAAAPSSEAAPTRQARKGKGGRLPRRSEEDIAAIVETIVTCVRNHPEGIGAEAIRKELKIDKKELGKPILSALESGQLRKEGEKRATVYFVGKKSSGAAAKPKVAKKTKVKAAPKAKAKKAKAAPKKAPKAKASSKKSGKKSTANGVAGHATAAPKAEPSAEATE